VLQATLSEQLVKMVLQMVGMKWGKLPGIVPRARLLFTAYLFAWLGFLLYLRVQVRNHEDTRIVKVTVQTILHGRWRLQSDTSSSRSVQVSEGAGLVDGMVNMAKMVQAMQGGQKDGQGFPEIPKVEKEMTYQEYDIIYLKDQFHWYFLSLVGFTLGHFIWKNSPVILGFMLSTVRVSLAPTQPASGQSAHCVGLFPLPSRPSPRRT
jgi:hypothetical protein